MITKSIPAVVKTTQVEISPEMLQVNLTSDEAFMLAKLIGHINIYNNKKFTYELYSAITRFVGEKEFYKMADTVKLSGQLTVTFKA